MLTPAFFRERTLLVVGGGTVAERKVKNLLLAGVQLAIISPTLTPTLQGWVTEGKLAWFGREWQSGDISEFPTALLVFIATNNSAVNAAIAQEAHSAGRMVNRADEPFSCDFVLPGVVHSDEITMAVATGSYLATANAEEGGASPALTAFLRRRLSQTFGPEYSALARLLREMRPVVKAQVEPAKRAALWRQMIESSATDLLRQNRVAEARNLLQTLIEQATQGNAEK